MGSSGYRRLLIASALALSLVIPPTATAVPATHVNHVHLEGVDASGSPTRKRLISTNPALALARESATEALQELVRDGGGLGTYVASDGTFVIVVPSSGSSSITEPALPELEVPIRLETRDIEPREIDAINEVVAARAWHPEAKNYSLGIGFDAQSGRVRVDTNAPEAVLRPLLDLYPNKIFSQYVSLEPTTHIHGADFQPHWGGAKLVDNAAPGGGYDYDCTSGFAVNNVNGNPRMVTAGHCFTLNEEVHSPDGSSFGTVTKLEDWASHTNDFELLGGGGIDHQGKIYVTDNSDASRWVDSAGNTGFGVESCWSGATTHETCGINLVDDDYPWCPSAYYPDCVPHTLLLYDGATSVGAACPGDSGSPFYRYVGTIYTSHVTIRGIVVGGDCASYTVVEKWPKIRDTYNVTIKTN